MLTLFSGIALSDDQGRFSNDSKLVVIGSGQNFTKENSLTFDNGVFSLNNGEITFSLSKQVSDGEGNNVISAINSENIFHQIEGRSNYYRFDANIEIPPQIGKSVSQITVNINSEKPIERFSETAYRTGNYVIDFSDAINAHYTENKLEDTYSENGEEIKSAEGRVADLPPNVELLTDGKVVFNDVAGKSVFSIDPVIIPVVDITVDTTWYSGNTYFVTAIVNVKNGAKLTIQPGAVIKFKQNNYLNIAGGYIKLRGEPTNKIHFTSCKDQAIGENLSGETGCDGAPAGGNYPYAVYYSESAKVNADTNNLSDLNFSFAKTAIYVYRISLNSIHNSTFQNNGLGYGHDGAAIYFNNGKITNLYNNTFSNNKARWGGAIAIKTNGGSEVLLGRVNNLYNNTFTQNEAMGELHYYRGGGAIHSDGKIINLYNNIFSENKAINRYHMEGGAIYLDSWTEYESARGVIENIYNNVFLKNEADYGGAIYATSYYSEDKPRIENIYNNIFLNNKAGSYGGGIGIEYCDMNNVYNNIFLNNKAGIGTDAVSANITNLRNNVFAFHKKAISWAKSNYNAFWQNSVNCDSCGANDINFTADPFLGDNSDKNFLIVPSQVDLIRDKGINIGNDNFFNTKTIGTDNEPDTGIRDIGYHYEVITACNDGVKNGDETDIDCGGSCLECEEGMHCTQDQDCLSGFCDMSLDQCTESGDLYIEWIKPIQVTESVDFVEGKDTVVRVKVVNMGPYVKTDLLLDADNGTDPKLETIVLPPYTSQTIDIYPGSYQTEGQYHIFVEIDSQNRVIETDETNNTKLKDLEVVDTVGIKIVFLRYDYPDLGSYRKDVNMMLDFLLDVYPINENESEFVVNEYPLDASSVGGDIPLLGPFLLASSLNSEINGGGLNADRVIGVVPRGWFSDRWVGASGITRFEYQSALLERLWGDELAHELGHTYNLCDEYKKSEWLDQNADLTSVGGCPNSFPTNCQEYPENCVGNTDINGFSVREKDTRTTGEKSNEGYTIWHSFMGSGGSNNWIEKDSYTQLLKKFDATAPIDPLILIIRGVIHADGEIDFDDFYLTDGYEYGISDGNYTIEFLDANNQKITNVNFGPSFLIDLKWGEDINSMAFDFAIEYNPAIHKIVGKYAGRIKDERTISSSAPTVSFVSPAGGENWQGTHTVNWMASDPDEDALSYILQYSMDDGLNWSPLAIDLNQNSFELAAMELTPGENYRLKVIATDGVLTGEAISNTFAVVNPNIGLDPWQLELGEVEQGEVPSFDIKLANTGNADLEIYSFNAPSNVTVSGLSLPLTLQAGNDTIFQVDLNTASFDGVLDQNIVFSSNDPNESEKHLFIEGKVFVPAVLDGNLHLSDMNFYIKEQPYYSGVASAKIILDYIRGSVGYHSLSQAKIYNYGHLRNRPENELLLELDADAMATVLGHFDPYDSIVTDNYDGYDSREDGNPFQGYNYTVESFPEGQMQEYMTDIIHWMAYPVTVQAWWNSTAKVTKPNTPAAIPFYGGYEHWITLNGFSASGNPTPEPETNPWKTAEVTIYGFWLTDPAEDGIGSHVYVTAADANALYFKPMQTNDEYDGKLIQVAEPPPTPPQEERTMKTEGLVGGMATGLSTQSVQMARVAGPLAKIAKPEPRPENLEILRRMANN